MRAGGVVEVQHLPNTHGHRVQLERGGESRREGRLFPGRKVCDGPSLGGVAQQRVLTRSIFIIVAEVQTNGSAELQHVAPLVFVYHFIF